MSLFTFLVVILVGLSGCQSKHKTDRSAIEKERIADNIMSKVALRLKQEFNLRPTGNMGQMLNEIERLGLDFNYYKSVDIAEGRRLLLLSVDALMEEINQDQRIHSYLCRYPFQPRNIEITIFLRCADGNSVPDGNLLVLQAEGGTFKYKINNPETDSFVTVYQETYQQAVERVADPSLPLVPYESNKKTTKEELSRLREGISFVDENGIIYHLDGSGHWVADPGSMPKK